MPAKLKIAKVGNAGFPQSTSGVVGGNTALAGNQIFCRVKIRSFAEANGFIIRQKGKMKFLVRDSNANTGICTLSDLANGSLTANTMTITCTMANASTFRAKSITNKFVTSFSNQKFIADNVANGATTPQTVAVALA